MRLTVEGKILCFDVVELVDATYDVANETSKHNFLGLKGVVTPLFARGGTQTGLLSFAHCRYLSEREEEEYNCVCAFAACGRECGTSRVGVSS